MQHPWPIEAYMIRGSVPLDLSDGERWALAAIRAQGRFSGTAPEEQTEDSNKRNGLAVTETQAEDVKKLQ